MNDILINIKSIRKDLGLTQKHMSDALKMEQSNYGKIESGAVNLSYNTLVLIAEIFKLRTIDIITYPDTYVNMNDISERLNREIEASIILKLPKDKKEEVLKIVFGESNYKLLNI